MPYFRPVAALVILLLCAPFAPAQTDQLCEVVVTSPAAGETWIVDQRYVIRWTSEGLCPAAFTRVELLGRNNNMSGRVIFTLTNVVNRGQEFFVPTGEMLGYEEYFFRFWGVAGEQGMAEELLGSSALFFISKDALPSLSVDPDRLRFVLAAGDASRTETVFLRANNGALSWKAVPGKGWMTASPAEGTLEPGGEARAVSVAVSAQGLGPDTYRASLVFKDAQGGEASAAVTMEMTVVPPADGTPFLEFDADRITFTHRLEDAYPPRRFTLSNTGTAPAGWLVEPGAPWLSITPSSGTLAAGASTTVTFIVLRDFAAPGSHRTFTRFKGSDGRDLTVLVSLNLTQPTAAGAWPPSSKPRQTLPVAANAPGAYGSFWSTDATVLPAGRSAQAAHARLKLRALDTVAGGASLPVRAHLERLCEAMGGPGRGTTQFIWGALGQKVRAEAVLTETALPDEGPTLFLDILGQYFGLTGASAFLQAAGDRAGDLLAVSRTYSTDAAGDTYGQSVVAPTPQEVIGPEGGTAYVPGLRTEPATARSKGWRSNLFVTELDGVPTAVTARLFDAGGNAVGNALSRTLAPYSQWQIVNIAGAFGTTAPWTYAEISSAGGGSVVALGSIVDNASNDPTTINGFVTGPLDGARTLFLPAVVRVPGAYGTHWHSDLTLLNASASTASFTLQFVPMAGSAEGVIEVPVTLPPFAMGVYPDIVAFLFHLDTAAGSVRLTGADPGTLLAFNRIYNLAADGSTYGQGTAAYRAADAVGLNDGTLYALGLERSPKYRTNAGVVETAGEPATVLFTVVSPAGEARPYLVSLAPGQWMQADDIIRDKAGFAADFSNAWVMMDVVAGNGRVIGYASIIDNDSSDATYIRPGRR